MPYPPPTTWNAINYAPRYHAFDKMLYDWNTADATTGMLVSTMVSNDLVTLSRSGVNVLHLYLWDKTLLESNSSSGSPDSSGFCSSTSDPAPCSNADPTTSVDPTGQALLFANLQSFLTLAETNSLCSSSGARPGARTSNHAGGAATHERTASGARGCRSSSEAEGGTRTCP